MDGHRLSSGAEEAGRGAREDAKTRRGWRRFYVIIVIPNQFYDALCERRMKNHRCVKLL
ncbi:MAG TPA: hypothetical protein PLR39_03145 [Treponemataceae bacterium]|nr:hypothetical protein [Treponemataceae bacterium]